MSTEQIHQLTVCEGHKMIPDWVDLLIPYTRSTIYILLMAWTFRKYGEHIVKYNKYLLIAWGLEDFFTVVVLTLIKIYSLKQLRYPYILLIGFSYVNFVVFAYSMFGLKSFQIYMD